jgi:WD40 repeat protein
MVLSPNGEQFVTGYGDGTVALWDATSLSRGFPEQEPQIPPRELTAMSFSPDGRQIASSYFGDARIHILDVQLGVEMTPLEGHGGEVWLITFSPCGNLIASGSRDATVRVWNLLSGAESLVLRGHKGSVNCVSFSHDGQRIVSGSRDTTVRLWNTTSGAQIFPTLHSHRAYLRAVAFSPDGTKGASADNECVCVWDIISGTKIFFQRVVTYRGFCRSLRRPCTSLL